jgi:glycosyltransferase involved in cell wall biosynthesis
MNVPVLSVLVPAYNYVSGIDRIVSRRRDGCHQVEYVIHDDSSDDATAALLASGDHDNVSYNRNTGPGNAIANWNGLLERANGQYVVLVHHDEFPSRMALFEDLAEHLGSLDGNGADVYLLGLRRLGRNRPWTNKLVPDLLRIWLLRLCPNYLIKRNFIGPSATFVVRRAICPRYDEGLKWLVDVDFYLKTLRRSDTVAGLSAYGIVSEIDRRDSITHSLAPDIAVIRARETAILKTRLIEAGLAKRSRLPDVLERIFWILARLAGTVCVGGRHGG